MGIDYKKLIEDSRKIATSDIIEEDISKEIMAVAIKIYKENQDKHPWWRGVDMIFRLQKLGKANVRNHLEKLVDHNKLESREHAGRKVYRLKVIEEIE